MPEAVPGLSDLCLHYLDHPRELKDCGKVCGDIARLSGAEFVFLAHYDPSASKVISWAVSSSEKSGKNDTNGWDDFARRLCRKLAAESADTQHRGFIPLPREDRPIIHNGDGCYYMEIRDELHFHGFVLVSGKPERLRRVSKKIELFIRVVALLCTRCFSAEASRSTAVRFEQFMENLPAYAFIKDREGRYIFTNQAYKKIGSVDPRERLGRTDFELFPPETARRIRENDEAVFQSGVPVETIEEIPYAGKIQHQLTVKFPLTEADGSVSLAGIAIDITLLVETERALETACKEKEILYRELQHRIKNTFSVITSLLRLENTRELSPESEALLRKLLSRVDAVSLVYHNLYGKEGSAPVDASAYLVQIAENLIRSYTDAADEGNRIRLETEIEPVELSPDTAVPLGIILTELLTNAVKYGFRKEGTTVRLSLSSGAEGLVFRVFDNGKPLPKSVDVENPETLGLKLVRALTSQLRGTLSLSRKGGTEFTLRIPSPDTGRLEKPS
ncbi:MAG: sensor histidine kinase, partial [Spirochaetia bacterium]